MKIHTVLFDLDGTITDSGQGIMNSVRYALRKTGKDVPGGEVLRSFVGPPLHEQFQRVCGITEEESLKMVDVYREYYSEQGIFENRLYDGIIPMLQQIKKAGLHILMATSKAEKYAGIIADHYGFAQYFDFIGGALMSGKRTDKWEVIEYALTSMKITDREGVMMVGDRIYDIEGARKAGIYSLGVLYGYGSREEMEKASPDFLAQTPEEAADIILKCAGDE